MGKFKLDWKTLVLKSIATGIILPVLALVANAMLKMINNMGFAYMESVLLILFAVLMVFAMMFRKGTENLLEAIVSVALVIGVWGVIGGILGVNPIAELVTGTGLFEKETLIFLTLFFIAEGITQRLLKEMKLL